jgi:hypothetical protein
VPPEPAPVTPPASGAHAAQPRLTVAAAARRLGVAPGTLRTWDRRYGIGPSEHAPGRHRRYSPDDVARLELMQRALVRGVSPADAARYALSVPLSGAGRPGPVEVVADGADPPGDPLPAPVDGAAARVRVGGRVLRLPGAGRPARGLGRAALALDAVAVRDVLAESVARDGVEATWDDVVRPVLVAVADRWADTGAGVEIEHLVSECVIAVFGAHPGGPSPAADVRPVLLAAMPGELHTLPLVALAAALARRGVAYRYLGANLPADALLAATRRTAPVAVVLWSQLAETADAEVLRTPRTRPRFRTFVAGPGWDGTALPPRTARLASLRAAVATITAAVLV